MNAQVVRGFLKDVLGIRNISSDEKFVIKREFKHIDILIESNKRAIIIENKIKSDINGKTHNGNQLSKYVAAIKSDEKELHCYLLTPNHNPIEAKDYGLGDFGDVEKEAIRSYKSISYKSVYEYFRKQQKHYQNVTYYEDFLKALRIHSEEFDNYLYNTMLRRFSMAIEKAKQK